MEASALVALIFIFLPWVLFLVSKRKNKNLEKQNAKIKEQLSEKSSELGVVLDKYKSIIDIEKYCKEFEDEANERSESLKNEAEKIVAKAEYEAGDIVLKAKSIKSEAIEKFNALKEKAEEIKLEARSEASKVISFAERKAKEIAGDAYEAKEKADSYENAIRAMRNTIEGYKDDYIIPNHSVLDDLADEYSHKEAGEKLKSCRKRMRMIVKDGHAGDCDYVESHRKTQAIHFAVDAFNGKVDSALSKVKHDNYGKIKQEIIDAYALVNHNGKPFRNARINQEFLDLRLIELKWAVRVIELKNIERQEQGEIKARIREEERAIREMEKARKEAEKEERLIQKALEKARAELIKASDEQKEQYEAQLIELETKLHEAEEKGQRALSMAQQTRRGHVYVISNIGSFGDNIFKVGMTRRLEPMDRVKELGDASVPFSFDVHAMIYSDDAPKLEKTLHQKFNNQSVNKINPRKEFFKTTLAEIKQVVEKTDTDKVHWTLKAEAAEYRESLAIEKEQQKEAVA